MILDELTTWFSANQAISTLVLATAFVLLKKLSERLLRGSDEVLSDERRRLITYSRNALALVLAIGLALIWAPALRTFALSVTAFMVALVIATKELILCITGGLLRTSAGAFSVGDWIRVGEQRGEVVDLSLLSLTLQELETTPGNHQFTGRTITLPNSVFLSTPVVNENFYKKFVYHIIQITLEKDDDPIAAADTMLAATAEQVAPSREVSRRYNALVKRRAGVEMPDIEPRLRYATSPEGRPRVAITAFVPTAEAEEIEQKVLARVLAQVAAARRGTSG
ncbi:MAG: mechanosensitive ion channel family protein [Rhodocyclaceae bacterium]